LRVGTGKAGRLVFKVFLLSLGLFATDWADLFKLLADRTKTGRVIILFDEISLMGSCDPDFLGKIKNAWDLHFKQNPISKVSKNYHS